MSSLRQQFLTRPIHRWARKALPTLSETEAEALNAGEVWWEADLFSGNPDWSCLHAIAEPQLSEEEQAFLEGPCEELCAMIDDWSINEVTGDLSPETWEFLKRHKFFGMIIPKDQGGLGFSAYAHSEIVRYISTRSVAAAVTVMVPNSLGPGELLLQFGTDAQKDYWLPRLADGREVPCFGLTSEEAGSDASAMVDDGVICRGEYLGEEVLGIRLNWSKRYITLAPVATVLGLAFKLRDPDHLLGEREELGITCALVPTNLPGVETGRRHVPSATMFQNGPTTGRDVFVPLENIIGGPDYAGRGWMMLMSALAAGRGISLPSMSAAASALSAHTSGAYARIRQQFGLPVGKFGGVQELLGGLAANAYVLDAARRLTCAGLDEGRSLSVISAIMKAHGTYRMRQAVDDAMDIHSGKAVIDGPMNYLSALYRAVPIGITVEGANVMTRNLIIFGQGSIRAHPHILDEMQALEIKDDEKSLEAFDRAFWAHVGHSLRTVGRTVIRAWSGSRLAPAPNAGAATPIYREMSRWAAGFALTADAAFLTLGGELKRREMISARMGDVLSELYFLSAACKRWEAEGRQKADLPLLRYAAAESFARIRTTLDHVIENLPARWMAVILRAAILPGGAARGPDDRLVAQCSDLLYEASPARDRILGRVYGGCERDGIRLLDDAFRQVSEVEPIAARIRRKHLTPEAAEAEGVITGDERARLDAAAEAVRRVVAVDDFSPEEIADMYPGHPAAPRTQEAAE